MEIDKLLEKKFGNKYNFLKLLDCLYDKSASLCTFVFMYPEDVDFEDEGEREEFSNLFKNIINLNVNIDVKFKKSYLDSILIKDNVLLFFESYHPSIFNIIKPDNIIIEKNENVIVKLLLTKKMIDFINEKIQNELISFLEDNFIGKFFINITEINDNNFDIYNLEHRVDTIYNDIANSNIEKVKRYNIQILDKVSGRDFIPKPEYIKDSKNVKTNVILAGIVSNLNKKTFIAKKGRSKGQEKYYFTFNINDGSGEIQCIYFVNKTAEKKAFNMCDGSHVAMLGDIKKEHNNRICFHANSLAFCVKLPDDIIEETKEEDIVLTTENELDTYKFVKLRPYIEYQQNDFFSKPIVYDDYIMNNTFVVYDIETTGLDHNNCDITEIGAVKVKNGVITDIFQTLIKPKHPIPDEVIELTHITNEMVANANKGEDIIKDFHLFCKDCILSGYNVINFDQKFINKLASKVNLKFDNEIIDVMLLAQKKIYLRNYKLSTLVKELNISLVGAHRALNDALATAKALLKLYEIK